MHRPPSFASFSLPAALIASSLVLAAGAARADDAPTAEERAAGELLYEEGKALLEAGRFSEACPKLERAVNIVRRTALGGLLDVAACYEADGKMASAWSTFSEVESKARAQGQEERAATARDRKRAIEPKLHFVVAKVPQSSLGLPGIAASINGRPVSIELLSARFPADAGTLTIGLTAEGHRPLAKSVVVSSGPGTTEVALDPLVPLTKDAPPPVMQPPVTPPGPGPESGPDGATVAGIVTLSAGVAAMGIGGALFFAADAGYPSECEEDGGFVDSPSCAGRVEDANDARALGDVAGGVFWSGAGVAVVGAVLIVVGAVTGDDDAAGSPLSYVSGCEGVGFALCLRGSFL